MIVIQINYIAHLLLISKYRIFINLVIIFIFYSLLYNNQIVCCMNENTNVIETPVAAEAKPSTRPSHQVQALKREILDFTDTHAQAIFLEKMRVEEEFIAITTRDPQDILTRMESIKEKKVNYTLQHCTNPVQVSKAVENLSTYSYDKSFLQQALGYPLDTRIDTDRAYYLLRMYRRLNGISG